MESRRRIRHGQDRTVVLQQEVENLGNLVETQAAQSDALEECLSLIDSLNEKPLSLDKAAQCIKELKVNYNSGETFKSKHLK